MNDKSKTESKSPAKRKNKPKNKPKAAAAPRHRRRDGNHPPDIEIDLDSPRADLRDLLFALNPILTEVLRRLGHPLELEDGDDLCVPGYHNITFCRH